MVWGPCQKAGKGRDRGNEGQKMDIKDTALKRFKGGSPLHWFYIQCKQKFGGKKKPHDKNERGLPAMGRRSQKENRDNIAEGANKTLKKKKLERKKVPLIQVQAYRGNVTETKGTRNCRKVGPTCSTG